MSNLKSDAHQYVYMILGGMATTVGGGLLGAYFHLGLRSAVVAFLFAAGGALSAIGAMAAHESL